MLSFNFKSATPRTSVAQHTGLLSVPGQRTTVWRCSIGVAGMARVVETATMTDMTMVEKRILSVFGLGISRTGVVGVRWSEEV